MIELHLIGYTADFEHLVFDVSSDGEGQYLLPVDPDLFATLDALREARRDAGLTVGDLEEFASELGVQIERRPKPVDALFGLADRSGLRPKSLQPKAEPRPEPKTEPALEPEFEIESEPDYTPEPAPEPRAEPRPEPRPEIRPEPRPETRPEPRPEPPPEPVQPVVPAAAAPRPVRPLVHQRAVESSRPAPEPIVAPATETVGEPAPEHPREPIPAAARPAASVAVREARDEERVIELEPSDEDDAPTFDPPHWTPGPIGATNGVTTAGPVDTREAGAHHEPVEDDLDEDEDDAPDASASARPAPAPMAARPSGAQRPSMAPSARPRPQERQAALPHTQVQGPRLTPAEIQALLRSGKSVKTVARMAEVDESRVETWLGPIMAEREQILDRAREARLVRDRLGRSREPLARAVRRGLIERGVDPDEASWDASRRNDGRWRIRCRFHDSRRSRTATWIYDPVEDRLGAPSDLARELGFTRRRS